MKFTSYASSSAGNLYTIEEGQTSLIIEAGVPYRDMQRLLPKAPSEYDACIYSHKHRDHYNSKSVEILEKRGIEVWGGGNFRKDGQPVLFGGNYPFEVKPFPVHHDVPNYGFIIRSPMTKETCIFIIDTFYCPVVPNFSSTIIAIECSYARDLMKPGDNLNDRLFSSHMSLGQCIETLHSFDLSQTREIHLLHLSDERSDEARFVREVQAATGVPTYAAPKRRAER